MKRTTINAVARFLLAERIDGTTFAKACGFERTRAHRIIHAQELAHVLRVGELRAIMRAYPRFELDGLF
jgi:hypothetical protein